MCAPESGWRTRRELGEEKDESSSCGRSEGVRGEERLIPESGRRKL